MTTIKIYIIAAIFCLTQIIYIYAQNNPQNKPQNNPQNVLPIVLISGGILSSPTNYDCQGDINLETHHIADWLYDNTGAKVYNIDIGQIGLDLSLGSGYAGQNANFVIPMHVQLDMLCVEINNIAGLANGFNLIGISQGGLLARGYVEHCGKYPVKYLITLATPHGGIYYYNFPNPNIYTPITQANSSISNYWRDPYNYEVYLSNSSYLAILNNEGTNHRMIEAVRYRKNMLKLAGFVMLWSPFDDVLDPPESGKFATYRPQTSGLPLQLLDITETPEYLADALGMQTLYNAGKIYIYETDCNHVKHASIYCLSRWSEYILPFTSNYKPTPGGHEFY